MCTKIIVKKIIVIYLNKMKEKKTYYIHINIIYMYIYIQLCKYMHIYNKYI